jgi:hypothetical protein
MIAASPALAGSNLWFIIDSSGSMAGKIDGERKIDIAKRTLRKLIGEVDAETKVTLLAYGHRRKNDCDDINALTGTMTQDKVAQTAAALERLKPTGKTPIARALRLTGMLAAKDGGDDANAIVLISDGIETCGGDPCKVAGELANAGVSVRTHVVGFAVSAKDRKQLECIARLGKGKYFSANSTEGFAKAVKGAIRVAAAPVKKTPPAPEWREVFRDDFDGEELNEHWTIRNPDPEAFVVEDGKLTLLISDDPKKNGHPVTKGYWKSLPNILTLQQPLPKGEWKMTIKFSFNSQTLGENIGLALANEKMEKMIAANLLLVTINYVVTQVNLRADKLGRKKAHFVKTIFTLSERNLSQRARQFAAKVRGIELRLHRKGHKYLISARFDKVNPQDKAIPSGWVDMPALTSLRPPGKTLTLFAGSFPNINGYDVPTNTENTIAIDWVKIEVPKAR